MSGISSVATLLYVFNSYLFHLPIAVSSKEEIMQKLHIESKVLIAMYNLYKS